jgi:hypothetical protein
MHLDIFFLKLRHADKKGAYPDLRFSEISTIKNSAVFACMPSAYTSTKTCFFYSNPVLSYGYIALPEGLLGRLLRSYPARQARISDRFSTLG